MRCFGHRYGTNRKATTPVEFALPEMKTADDAVKAAAAILEAVAGGALTPSEGTVISALVIAAIKR